jgi:hypothetical protein
VQSGAPAVMQGGAPAALAILPQEGALAGWLAAHLPGARLETGIAAVAETEVMLDRNVAGQLACEHLAVVLLGEAPVSVV